MNTVPATVLKSNNFPSAFLFNPSTVDLFTPINGLTGSVANAPYIHCFNN
ncbi:hypothetical protein MNBD_GAMMA05-343 [hydrothermal vent metagenome]|uniref:Uncharacterized protein n=1 Tax=hydrothermal vent metagenome TaxID=652676 RepID=A0A3B0WS12_9ZZZZ